MSSTFASSKFDATISSFFFSSTITYSFFSSIYGAIVYAFEFSRFFKAPSGPAPLPRPRPNPGKVGGPPGAAPGGAAPLPLPLNGGITNLAF